MTCYLFHEEYNFFCIFFRRIVSSCQCFCKIIFSIVFLYMVDSFLCNISDWIDISKYCDRIAISFECLYRKGWIDQRVGTCKCVILSSCEHMVISKCQRNLLHYFFLSFCDTDTIRFVFIFFITFHADFFCQEPAFQMI